jgi:MFS family permease
MLTGRLGPLQQREFRLLWAGRTASSVGDALIPVALAFAVLESGGSASGLGLVFAAFTLSRVAFILAGGVWADRLSRRAVMLACDLIRAGVDAFTAVALLTGEMRLWMFFVTAALFGGASSFFGPASTGLVPQTVPPERLQQANALLSLSQSATNVFGPAVSGLVVATAGAGWVFAVDSVSFVASAAFLLAMRLPAMVRPPTRRFFVELAEGWSEIRSRRWLWTSFIAFSLGNIGIASFFVLGPVIARNELGGARAWGLVLTGMAVGGVAGGALAYRLKPRRPLVAAFSVWPLAALPLLALVPPLPVLAIAAAAGAFAIGIEFGNAIWETVMQSRIPTERLGRVSAYDWMISLVFMPLGNVLAGPLADAVGVHATLVGAAALIVAADFGAMLLVPEVRGLRRVEAPAPATA